MPKKKSRDTRFSDYGSFFGMISGGGRAKIRRDADRDASDIAAGRGLGDEDGNRGTALRDYAHRQAEVFLPTQSSFEAKLLGAGRAKFSPLGATETLKEEVGSDVASIWDTLENVRTANKAADHYHNGKIMQEFYSAVSKRPDPAPMTTEQAITGSNLRTEMLRIGIDVPSPNAHPIMDKVRRKFGKRITTAIDVDDQESLIGLSAEIAEYLNMSRPETFRRPPPGNGNVDPSGLLGRVQAKDKQKRDEVKAVKEQEGGVGDDDGVGQDVAGPKKALDIWGKRHTFSDVREVQSEPIELGSATSLVLDETRGLWGRSKSKFKGIPSRDIWRLSMLGDTAVFEDNPKVRGKVAIMVDMSGSMGCPCPKCLNGRRSRGYHNWSPAWLAWQAAGAIMKAFPESVVYSYSSGRGGSCSATIATNPVGQQPVHEEVRRHMGGGTPTCTGSLFLKQVILTDIGASAAVLITDGYPNYTDCTAAVNHGFVRDGLRFASILIGHDLSNMDTIFPSESSVNISSEDELYNLQNTMRFLAEVRQ